MISADDVFSLSERLAILPVVGGEEARCRSAISRAYYASFHWAKDVLGQFGVAISAGPAGHAEATRYLSQCGLPNAESVGRKLVEFRTMRNNADYELQKNGFESCKTAKLWIEIASRIKSELQSWQHDRLAAQAAFDKLKALPQFRK